MNVRNSAKYVFEKKLPRYIIGAFSVATAFAYSDLIKDQLEQKVMNKSRAKFLYAITSTVILIFAIFIIHKFVDIYMNIKNTTDQVVTNIICHKKAIAKLQIGNIYINRTATKRLVWTFDTLNLLPNGRYDILINSCEPVRITMSADNNGKLQKVITHEWELDELLGHHLDFKDYAEGSIYTGIISVYKN